MLKIPSRPRAILKARSVWLLILLGLSSTLNAQTPEYRAQWADAFHHPLGTGSSASMVQTMINNIRAANGNVVIPEIRVYSDAMYVPRAQYYPNLGHPTTGIGTINSNGVILNVDVNSDPEPRRITSWDPLATVIERAHDTTGGAQRLDVWAWLVSFRTGAVLRTAHPTWLTRKPDGTEVTDDFDPGHPGVQQQLLNVCTDILANYDVDGLNFDYIRFTASDNGYNPTSIARFNAQTGRTGTPSNSDSAWKQWRREQITNVVRKIYLHAIAQKPSVKMSVDTITWSPAPLRPTSTTNALQTWKNNFESTSAAYNSTYQDWRSWMEEGITDISIPMNYFKLCTHETHYERWADFSKDTAYNRQTVIGPGVYMNSLVDSLYQVKITRAPSSPLGTYASGQSLYSYASGAADSCGGTITWNPSAMGNALVNGIPEDPTPAYPTKVPIPTLPRLSNGRGHLMGTITDPGIAAPGWVDGATVTLTGPLNRTIKTDGTGFYGFVDLLPGTYSVKVTATGLPAKTRSAVVTAYNVTTLDVALTPPAASALIFTTQPGGAREGQVLDPQPVVMAVDDNGLRFSNFTGPVTLSIADNTGSSGASLLGTTTVNAENGVAVFDNVAIDTPGTDYVLRASSGTLTPANSTPVHVTTVPTQLAFTAQPPGGISNLPLPASPVVEIRNSHGQLVTDATQPVALTIQSGTGTPGALLKGTVVVVPVGGIATFTDVRLDRPGEDYVLSAAADGLTSAATAPFTVVPRIARVSSEGNDEQNGLAWAGALRTVSYALANTGPGDEIWVAAGEYAENISLKDGVRVFGGFAGSETDRQERDLVRNGTILDGGAKGSVVTAPYGVTETTVLDGFTLRNGTGTMITGYTYGGGVYIDHSSPTLSANSIVENTVTGTGGGIYVDGGNPVIVRNTIRGNSAEGGGGIYTSLDHSVIKNNVITGNTATVGGGLKTGVSTPLLVNNTIASNTATLSGAGIYLSRASATTMVNNIVAFGASGIWADEGASLTMRHNAVWVPDGTPFVGMVDPTGENGNVSLDPMFVDPQSGDFHLLPGSLLQDAGTATVIDGGELDHDGQPRIQGAAPDIGAYELAGFPPPTIANVMNALRIAGGLDVSTDHDLVRWERASDGESAGVIDLLDVIHLAREVSGLD